MTYQGPCFVENLSISREPFGSITFLDKVDISLLDFDKSGKKNLKPKSFKILDNLRPDKVPSF